MDALKRMLYVSRATMGDPTAVQRIVQVARERNATLRVTGMLIFSGEHFVQCLEGPEEALNALLWSIRADRRHVIQYEWPYADIGERWFPRWSMGYVYDDRIEELLARLDNSFRLPKLDSVLEVFQEIALNKRSVSAG